MESTCFVCVTSYQFLLSSVFARELFDRYGVRSYIVTKYVAIPDDQLRDVSRYSDVMVIPGSFRGKCKGFLLSRLGLLKLTACGKRIISHRANLAFFNDRDPLTQSCYRLIKANGGKAILIEEGIGTYCGGNEKLKAIGLTLCPDVAIVGYPELYLKTHPGNTRVAKLDYPVFYYENTRQNREELPLSASCEEVPIVLFLGQAFDSETRMVEYDIVAKVAKAFRDSLILVKPHPRDTEHEQYCQLFNSYNNIVVITGGNALLPVEELVRQYSIASAVSLFSSGCLTLANIYPGLQAYMAYKVMKGSHVQDLDRIVDFAEYCDNLHIVDSVEDLIMQMEKQHSLPTDSSKAAPAGMIDLSPFV